MRHVILPLLSILGGFAVLSHCGQPQSEPYAGGETHFMVVCHSDDDCIDLSCICGVCTETCEDGATCVEQSSRASCSTNPCGTQTCGVTCAEDADCSEFLDSFRCVGGSCRAEGQLGDGTGGDAGMAAGGANSLDVPTALTCAEAAARPPLDYVETGRLTLVQELLAGEDFQAGEGVTALALSPDGAHLYVTGHFSDELLVFSRNPADGTLAFSSALDATDGLGDFLKRPNRPVFADATGEIMLLPLLTGERLGAWARSPETGAVAPLSGLDFPLNEWPEDVVQAKDSDYLFMTLGGTANTVVAVEFDPSSVEFGTPVSFDRAELAPEAFEIPDHIVASRGGKDAYFIAVNGDALHHLRFDAAARQWSYAEGFHAGEDHLLKAPRGLALSPDEHHVYVAAFNSARSSVYMRDCDSGKLTRVVSYAGFDDAYVAPSAVTVSPDGENVYMNLEGPSPGVAAYARDFNTGRLKQLNFVEVHPEAAFMYELLVSPDGRHVYASHINPSTILVFERSSE